MSHNFANIGIKSYLWKTMKMDVNMVITAKNVMDGKNQIIITKYIKLKYVTKNAKLIKIAQNYIKMKLQEPIYNKNLLL